MFRSFCKTGLSGHGRGLCQCGAGDQQLAVLYFSALSILYMIVNDFLVRSQRWPACVEATA